MAADAVDNGRRLVSSQKILNFLKSPCGCRAKSGTFLALASREISPRQFEEFSTSFSTWNEESRWVTLL